MADKDKKKLKNDLKQDAKDAEAKKIVNERMHDVYEQAKKLEKNGIKVEIVEMPADTAVVVPKTNEVVKNDTVKANVTTVIKRKDVTR